MQKLAKAVDCEGHLLARVRFRLKNWVSLPSFLGDPALPGVVDETLELYISLPLPLPDFIGCGNSSDAEF